MICIRSLSKSVMRKSHFSVDDLLVDCGATAHILNDESKFVSFDNRFSPSKHYLNWQMETSRIM
jgi:hypothetical protein